MIGLTRVGKLEIGENGPTYAETVKRKQRRHCKGAQTNPTQDRGYKQVLFR